MPKVIFNEKLINARVLGADDLAKAGVEGFRKTTFVNGDPVEVSDEVFNALINEDMFGEFISGEPDEVADIEGVEIIEDESKEELAKAAAKGEESGSIAAPAEGSTPSRSASTSTAGGKSNGASTKGSSKASSRA